ncbi:hypothetical protein HID58_005454, partial [Brassica napus]
MLVDKSYVLPVRFSRKIWSNLTKGMLGHHHTSENLQKMTWTANGFSLYTMHFRSQFTLSGWKEICITMETPPPPSTFSSIHKTVDKNIHNRLSLL